MADLDSVKASLRSFRNQLAAKKAEKQGYLNTAADIGAIYDRMAEDKELIDDYDLVISNIDTNMDRLNTARAQYENKAYKCNGPIGYLQSSVNSLVHTIENWVN